jgi:hypothetical protein
MYLVRTGVGNRSQCVCRCVQYHEKEAQHCLLLKSATLYLSDTNQDTPDTHLRRDAEVDAMCIHYSYKAL